MTSVPLSRRERKKQQNRQRLLDCAIDLFQTQGFDKTTVDDIAEAADVSRGTFFNYFPTKEHLLDDIGDAALDDFSGMLPAVCDEDAVPGHHAQQCLGHAGCHPPGVRVQHDRVALIRNGEAGDHP